MLLGDHATRFRARYQAALALKRQVAEVLDGCYEFALPLRNRMNASGTTTRTDRLFDSTASTALQGFASQVLDDLWPTDARPFDLLPGSEVPPDKAEQLRLALSAFADEIISTVNNSDFRAAAHEMLLDYGIGQGVMLIEPGDAVNPIRHTCVPLSEAVLALGPYGAIDGLFRCLKPKVSHLDVIWPDAKLPPRLAQRLRSDPEAKAEVIEGVERDWSTPGEETWRFTVLMEKPEQAVLVEATWTGSGACPFIAPSFTRVAGEILGRGPVQIALPDIMTLNLVKQYVLENADLAIGGRYQVEDDGVINVDTISMERGTIIPIAAKSRGIQPIPAAGDFNVGDLLVKDLQAAIREAMFVNDLGPLNQTPRSATEIMQRTADRAKRLAGPRGRLLTEALFPYVRRVAWLMKQRGGIQLPPFDGKMVAIRPTGPLSRAQAQQDVLQIVQFSELMSQFEGPERSALIVNGGRRAAMLADKIGVPPSMLNTDAEKQQMMQAMAQMAAQQAQAQAPAQGAA